MLSRIADQVVVDVEGECVLLLAGVEGASEPDAAVILTPAEARSVARSLVECASSITAPPRPPRRARR